MFGIGANIKYVSTLLTQQVWLSPLMSPKSEGEHEYKTHIPYVSVNESLMYVMVCTRSDISQVVSMVSKYMHNPSKCH